MILPACLVILVFSNGSAYFSIRDADKCAVLNGVRNSCEAIDKIYFSGTESLFSKVALTFF
jgi:hypothetical protein